jgi:hypothetical protein
LKVPELKRERASERAREKREMRREMRRERERESEKEKLKEGGLSTADLKADLVERLDEAKRPAVWPPAAAKDNGTKPNSQPMGYNTMEEEELLDLLKKKFLEKDMLPSAEIINALALRGIEMAVEEEEGTGKRFLNLFKRKESPESKSEEVRTYTYCQSISLPT